MSQQAFHDRNRKAWFDITDLMENLRAGKADPRTASFPEQYRQVCQHLALARHRRYGAEIVEGLNRIALVGHQHFYGGRHQTMRKVGRFVAVGFPRAVRAQSRLLLLAAVLFCGPALAMGAAITARPALIYTVVSPAQAANIEEMYDPAGGHFLQERESGGDLAMFGFYISNNIGIGFRTFAAGVLFCVGAAVTLIFNGLLLGAVAAHLGNVGYTETFYSFVIGHGAFELTAIVLAGQAGMMLGAALLAPGRRARVQALKEEGKKAVIIVYGVAGMLLIAAFLEAFWSSTTMVSPTVKLAVGACLWAFVLAYLALGGRGGARGA